MYSKKFKNTCSYHKILLNFVVLEFKREKTLKKKREKKSKASTLDTCSESDTGVSMGEVHFLGNMWEILFCLFAQIGSERHPIKLCHKDDNG